MDKEDTDLEKASETAFGKDWNHPNEKETTSQVTTGDFGSVSEAHREALRRFRDQKEAKKLYHRRLVSELEDSKEERIHKLDSQEKHESFYRKIEEEVFSERAHT